MRSQGVFVYKFTWLLDVDLVVGERLMVARLNGTNFE